MLSPFLVSPLKIPYPLPLPLLTNPPTPASWPWHSPILGHRTFTGSRASPPIDDRLSHPLLHMQLEPWVLPWVFFDWWFVPSMGLQTPSPLWVLSLAPSLGTLCSVQWMTVSILNTSLHIEHLTLCSGFSTKGDECALALAHCLDITPDSKLPL